MTRIIRTSAIGALAVVALVGLLPACSSDPAPIQVGALYPLSGSQGPGGLEEFRGAALAADMANASGGVGGRPIHLTPIDVPGSDAAAAGVDALHADGVSFVLGSYGSTISSPAADEAARKGMLFWETGAVGGTATGSAWGTGPGMPEEALGAGAGRLVFRVAPSGAVLGAGAISFIAQQLAPAMHRDPTTLRFAVTNVDDAYGRSVADGAVAEIYRLGLPFVGRFPYDVYDFSPATVIRHVAAAKPDVLFVSAYVDDGVALRRQMVAQHLHLVANIGSSSSYCMLQFGQTLGEEAVGLFASDKPDADAISPSGLSPGARALLAEANAAYHGRYGADMTAAGLAGFSGAWALFHDVMPAATAMTPAGVASSALAQDLPQGSLPNGSGLRFGHAGTAAAGANMNASSVIWEWTAVGTREVIWPPRFATAHLEVLTPMA